MFQLGKLKPLDLYGLLPTKIVVEGKLREVDPELESFFNLNAPEDLRRGQARHPPGKGQ